MRGHEGNQKENMFIIIGAIAVFAVLLWFTMRSPYILHRFELPFLKTQAAVYSVFSSSIYGKERELLGSFLTFLNNEYKKHGYQRINVSRAREYLHRYGRVTAMTSKILAAVVLVGIMFPFIRAARRAKKLAYDRDQYISGAGIKGVEGFLNVVGKHIPQDLQERLRAEPTTENILAAFSIAREKANIPNNLAGRVFPRWSNERMAVYAYGKEIVEYDINSMMKLEGNCDKES